MIELECVNLTHRYGRFTALDNVSLQLEGGKIVGLLGPNGSGKTTLIKIACGLLQPSQGELLIEGQRPGPASKQAISYLPDRDFLPEYMTVADMCLMYADFYEDFDYPAAVSMLKELGISSEMTTRKMSKGMNEKVRLVLTMCRKARIYILDEPIAGVDPAARDYILRTIINNYNPAALVLISTHLIADVESILDEAVFLKNGQIILHKSADDIRNETGESVDAYFREVFRC
ncbi:MAG: ABC transporter ATP-binding protein [Solobacterium sp.]|nr:ABC transporter ATP-binding protein [Solobacterium sp.]